MIYIFRKNILLIFYVVSFSLLLLAPKIVIAQMNRIKLCRSQEQDDIDKECTPCEDNNCYKCFNNQCFQCLLGYDYQNNQCLKIDQTCLDGNQSDIQKKECLKCQVQGCIKCQNQYECRECQIGFQPKGSNKQCILELFVNEQTKKEYSYYKTLLRDNDYELKYNCPFLYTEISENRICNQMQFCSGEIKDEDFQFNDPIIQIIIYEIKNLTIIVSQKQVALFDSQSIQLIYLLIDLKESKAEEYIHNVIMVLNIINIFTNERIIPFDLQNQLFLKTLNFKQSQYYFPIQGRFYLYLEEKQINYIYMDDTYLNISFLQMKYEDDQNKKIISKTYEISKKANIQLRLEQNNFYSITYIGSEKQEELEDFLFLTSKELFTIIILDKTQINQDSQIIIVQSPNHNFIKSNSTEDLEYSEIYDQIEFDKNKNIYLQRLGIYYYVTLDKDLENKKRWLNIKKLAECQLKKNCIASLQKLDQIIFLQLQSELNQKQNLIVKKSIVIQFKQSNDEISYKLQNFIINGNVTQIYMKIIKDNQGNNYSILMIAQKSNLFIFKLNQVDQVFTLKQIFPINQNIHLDLSLSQFSISQYQNDNPLVEIFVPFYKNLIQFKVQNDEIKVNQLIQQSYYDQNDYFNLYFQEQTITVAEQMIVYDQLNKQLFLFDIMMSINTIQIQRINIEKNQLEISISHNLFILNCYQTSSDCIQSAYVDINSNNLLLFAKSQVFLFHKYTLQKINEIAFQDIDYKESIYPFIKVKGKDEIERIIYVSQDGEFKNFKLMQKFQQLNYKFLRISPKQKRCLLLYIKNVQTYKDIYTQMIFCDDKELKLSENKIITQIKEVEFINDYEFIVIYIRDDGLLSLLRQKIIIENNKIEEKEETFDISKGFLDIDRYNANFYQYLIVHEQIQLYFRVIQNSQQLGPQNGIIEVVDLTTVTIIQKLKTMEIKSNDYQWNTSEFYFDVQTLTLQIHYKKFLISGNDDIIIKIQKFTYSIESKTFSEYWFSYFNGYSGNQEQINSLNYRNNQQSFSYTDIDSLNHFIGFSFQNKNLKKNIKSLSILYEQNLVYFNDGERSLILQNIPLLKNQKFYQFQSRKQNNNWWISDKLGLIIILSIEQQIAPTPIVSSQKISFILLDTLEPLFSDLNISSQAFVFWNEKYTALIVCEDINIIRYSIQNSSLYKEYSYIIQIQNFQFNNSNGNCIMTEFNPLIFCSRFGIFDFIKKVEIFADIEDIKIQSFISQKQSIIENDFYVIFAQGENQLYFYTIQNKKLLPIHSKIITDINKLQLAFQSGNQALYVDPGQGCYIFLLPTFEIMQSVKIDSNSSNQSAQVCQFTTQTQILMKYIDETMYLYKISEKNIELELVIKKEIELNIQPYFKEQQADSNDNKINPIQSQGRYFIGQFITQKNTRFETYRTYLLIDSETGELQIINGQITKYPFSIILNIWQEKSLMITDDQLITISDMQLQIKLNGQDDDYNSQKYKYSKNYNYLIYESQDNQELCVMDVSEFLPSQTFNSYLISNFNMESANVFLTNVLNDQNNITRELIYFDNKKFILFKAIYNIQIINQEPGTKQQINKSAIKSHLNILNINIDLNKNYQTIKTRYLYQVFLLHKDTNHLKTVYVLNYGCQLFVIQENGNIIQTKDLTKYQCTIKKAINSFNNNYSDSFSFNNQQNQDFQNEDQSNKNKDSILYLVKDNLQIEQLIYQNEKFTFQVKYTESVTSSIIKSYLYWKNDKNSYSCITYRYPHNKIIINRQPNDKVISKIILIDNVGDISNYIFLSIQKEIYFIIGADNKIITFHIEESNLTDFKVNQINRLDLGQRGNIQNILYYTTKNQLQNILIATTKTRILLFHSKGSQKNLIFELMRESLIHSRNYHKLKIFKNNQIIMVFSQLQISLYSLSTLQFIGRIEEQSIKLIRDIQMVEVFGINDQNIRDQIFVCDQDKIIIYDIKKFKDQQRLQIQKYFKVNLPIIYELISSRQIKNMNKDFIIINGAHISGPYTIKYILNQNILQKQTQKNNYDQQCINAIFIPQKFYEQQRLYENLLQQQSNDKIFSLYILFEEKKDLLIPVNLINNLYIQKKLNIHIDLNQQSGNLKTILTNEEKKEFEGSIHTLKIQNGIIVINESISLFDIDTLVFNNVLFLFGKDFLSKHMMQLQEIKSISFENVIFEVDDQKNELETQQNLLKEPLISLNNCTKILINFQIRNMRVQRDILSFKNNENIEIQQMKYINLESHGRLMHFTNQNLNITIFQLQIKNSQILYGITIIDTDYLQINKIQISNVTNVIDQKIQQRILSDQTLEQIEKSFLFIRLVLQNAKISNVNVNQNSILHQFLNYSCSYKLDGVEKTVQNTQLELKNFIIQNSSFIQNCITVQESQIDFSLFKSIKSQNTSINITNSILGLKLSKVAFVDNTFNDTNIIYIKDSLVKLYDINFIHNIIQNYTKELNIYAIQIYNSSFSLNKVYAHNNTSPDYFMLIKDFILQPETDFFKINEQQLIYDLNIQNSNKGALQIQDQRQITIEQSVFINNNIDNQTQAGGAINIANTELCKLIQSQIKNNKAIQSGGGIYMKESDIFIIESQITNNSALIGGGIRYNKSISPIYLFQSCFKECIYSNQAVIFGQNYGSEPKIKIISNLDNWTSSVNQYISSLVFKVYGEDGELANFEYSKEEEDNQDEITKTKINLIKDYTSFKLFSINRNVIISDIKLDNSIKHQFNITSFITNSGYKDLKSYYIHKNEQKMNDILNRKTIQIKTYWKDINFTVSFRRCIKGEIIQEREQDTYECHLCIDNTYSIQNPYEDMDQTCRLCKFGSSYCKGSLIIPSDGFWVDPGTDDIEPCVNMPSKCVSLKYQTELDIYEYNNLTNGCIEGGYGPLCESCDYENLFWGKNKDVFYAKKNRYECYTCQDKGEKVIQYILTISLIIVVYAFIIYQLFQNILTNLIKLKALLLKKLKLIYISTSLLNKNQQSTVLKIIISYLQIVSFVLNYRLNIPDIVQKLLFFIGNIFGLTFYVLDCLFVQTGLVLNIKIIYLRLIWTLVFTIISIIILTIIGQFMIKKYQLMKYKKNVLISGFTQFYYLIYPSIVQQTVGTLCCKNVNKKYYILLDIQYKCFDSDYYYFNMLISLPLLIITTIIPLIIFFKIKKYKQNLTNVNVYLNYGFFFQEYKAKNFYWEIIRIYKKIFLYGVIGIFNQSNIIAGLLVCLSIIFYIKYQQQLMPYNILFFNRLDHFSQITAVVTIFSFIINTESDSIIIQYFFLGFIILINFLFFFQSLLYFILITSPQIKKSYLITLQNYLRFTYMSIPTISSNHKTNILRVTKSWKKIQDFIKINKFLRGIKDSEQKDLIQNSIDKQLYMNQNNSIKNHHQSNIQQKSIFLNDEIDEKFTCKSIQMTRNVLIYQDDASSEVQDDIIEFKKSHKKKSQSVGYQFKI